MAPAATAVRVPATPEQWAAVLGDVGVVLAGRVQIAMVAAMHGTPAVAVVADEAAMEMVRAMHVPYVTAAEVVDMAAMVAKVSPVGRAVELMDYLLIL